MKSLALFFLRGGCVVLALAGVFARGQTDPSLQEPDVLYLDGNLPARVTTALKATTTLYAHRNFQTVLAVLAPGQKVEVVGTSAEGYLLKGTFRNNTVTGWIRPEDLPTGIDPGVFAQAKKNQDLRNAVAVAITNKTVIPGMTVDQVRQAVGRPEQTASRLDASGSSLTWIFTTYRQEPQYTYAFDPLGRPLMQTYYVKIPIGQLVVGFANGVVSSVEERKTNPNSPGVVTN